MIEDLFLNAMFIIAFISLENQFFLKDHTISKNSSIILKVTIGVMNGILGSALMIYSVTVAHEVLFDFRHVAIILSSLFGGYISSILSSILIGLFRIFHFGLTFSSIVAFLAFLIAGFVFPMIIRQTKTLKNQWLYTAIFSNLLIGISYCFLIKDIMNLIQVVSAWWISNAIISYVLYKYTDYIITSNELIRRYKFESTKDFLTGLNNVRQFDEQFNLISARAIKHKEPLSLLFLDIDFFKQINDQYGHGEGDLVLKKLGEILQNESRQIDIVSRNGGEEFSVILTECSAHEALIVAERIRKAVEKHDFVLSNGKTINITISIGVATYPETSNHMNKIKEEADQALYEAKRTGRNKVVLHK